MNYRIIKKYIKGVETVGYYVIKTDENNIETEELLKVSEVISLCRKKLVDNAELILDSDEGIYEINILNNDDIEKVVSKPKQKDLIIVGKIISTNDEGKKFCSGYIIKDASGRQQKISIVNAWKYARSGCINNVKANVINGKKVIISTDNPTLDKLHRMSV